MKMFILLLMISVPVSALAVTYNAVSITPTSTLIFSVDKNRGGWIICNTSTATIYVGGDSSITTTNAIPLMPNEKILSDGGYAWNGSFYGIVPAGANMELRYLEWDLNEISQ